MRVVCCYLVDCATASLLYASAVERANAGYPGGLCSDLPCDVQVSSFPAVVGLHVSPRFSTVVALSPCRQVPGVRSTAGRQAAFQVAQTQAATSRKNNKDVCTAGGRTCAGGCVGSPCCLWEHSVWWEGRPNSSAKTASLLCGDGEGQGGGGRGVQSEAELNKRLLARLGDLLRSVTASPPARREDGARCQQTQLQRHQEGQKNRRGKRKSERDNSLVGGLQRLVDRM